MNLLVKHLSGDRRSARRYHIKVPLRYRLRRSTASEHTAESENLSELGVFFAADIELSVGAAIDLIVEMPTELSGASSVQWLCTGHVVRIERSGSPHIGNRIGIQFDCYEILRRGQGAPDFAGCRALTTAAQAV